MLNDRLVAHRGFQKLYPENTLLGLRKAIEAGAHYIELDIQFTADKQAVIYHDLIMSRVSGKDTLINGQSLEELQSTPAYEPQRLGDTFISESISPLSRLVPLLQAHPEVTAFVELKREAIAFIGIKPAYEKVVKTLHQVGPQCILISFDAAFIEYTKLKNEFRYGLVLRQWQELEKQVAMLEPEYLFCDVEKIPEKADLNSLPFLLVVYEVSDSESAAAWFERGVDLVETFDIGGLLENLGHKAI